MRKVYHEIKQVVVQNLAAVEPPVPPALSFIPDREFYSILLYFRTSDSDPSLYSMKIELEYSLNLRAKFSTLKEAILDKLEQVYKDINPYHNSNYACKQVAFNRFTNSVLDMLSRLENHVQSDFEVMILITDSTTNERDTITVGLSEAREYLQKYIRNNYRVYSVIYAANIASKVGNDTLIIGLIKLD